MSKKVLDSIHESAKDLHDIGLVNDVTMREFDALCLPEVKRYNSSQIKRLRKRSKASQAVFARHLNIAPSTVQKWEQGLREPKSASLKLLNIVDRKGLAALE